MQTFGEHLEVLRKMLFKTCILSFAIAIALFGPTEASRYGYNEHICLQANLSQCNQADKCLGPHVANNYSTPCPLREKHCMNTLDEYKIVDITMSLLNSNSNGK